MRNQLWLSTLILVACGAAEERETVSATADAPAANRIECALGGSDLFAADCAIERSAEDVGTLTIRHPDGGFRRLVVTGDGRGVMAADGSAAANVQVIADERIEVAIERDRYRLPATVKGR
jgi:hypothetical protein